MKARLPFANVPTVPFTRPRSVRTGTEFSRNEARIVRFMASSGCQKLTLTPTRYGPVPCAVRPTCGILDPTTWPYPAIQSAIAMKPPALVLKTPSWIAVRFVRLPMTNSSPVSNRPVTFLSVKPSETPLPKTAGRSEMRRTSLEPFTESWTERFAVSCGSPRRTRVT